MQTSRRSPPWQRAGISRNCKDETLRVAARISVNRSAYLVCAMRAIECDRVVIDGNDVKAGFGNVQFLECCQQTRQQSLTDATPLMRTKQIESIDAIRPRVAETDNLVAVGGYQKDIATAKRAPPPEFAFSSLKRVCLRAEQGGIGFPIGSHMDLRDRRNVIEHGFPDLIIPATMISTNPEGT